MNKTTKANQDVRWMKMNDFFPSEKQKTEFEISFERGSPGVRCSSCGESMQRVFIRAGDTPIFSGWGSCRCKPKQ